MAEMMGLSIQFGILITQIYINRGGLRWLRELLSNVLFYLKTDTFEYLWTKCILADNIYISNQRKPFFKPKI
jgi:hypothetical protein